MRKILIALAPVLAVAAFAAGPTMASAATLEFGTRAGNTETGRFTALSAETAVTTKGTTSYVLETPAAKSAITCTALTGTGHLKNVSKTGEGTETLTYSGCSITEGEGAGCPVEPIKTAISIKVITETTEEITVTEPAVVKLGAACGGTELGKVEGKATGTLKGDVLEFAKASGLTFAGAPSTITGKSMTEVTSNKDPIYVN